MNNLDLLADILADHLPERCRDLAPDLAVGLNNRNVYVLTPEVLAEALCETVYHVKHAPDGRHQTVAAAILAALAALEATA